MSRRLGGVLCSAGAMMFGAGAMACPTELPTGFHTGWRGGPSSCHDPCGAPADCGPGGLPASAGGPSAGTGGSLRGGPVVVDMLDNFFDPLDVVIKPGDTVRWDNVGFFIHTATRTPTWDSGLVNPGESFEFTFTSDTAGLFFDYVCVIHFGMDGRISVARFGDANLDGIVNLNDFNVLAANFGQSGREWETGDFDGDGLVNLNDFNLLAANFGGTIEPAPFTAGLSEVPEPASIALLAPLALATRRRRAAN